MLPLESFRAASPHPQDAMILEVARAVFSSLNIHASPETLLWASVVPKSVFDGSAVEAIARGGTRSASSDECCIYRNAILLAKGMRGQLGPEEWRPLITSSLVFHKKLRTRLMVRLIALSWAPLVVLLVGFFFALFVAAISGAPAWIALVFVPFLFLGGFLVEGSYNWSVRNSWLVADRQSAELVGRLEFVTVLKKLDSLGMPDIQKRSARNRIIRLFLVDRPSIEERIRNAELEP